MIGRLRIVCVDVLHMNITKTKTKANTLLMNEKKKNNCDDDDEVHERGKGRNEKNMMVEREKREGKRRDDWKAGERKGKESKEKKRRGKIVRKFPLNGNPPSHTRRRT